MENLLVRDKASKKLKNTVTVVSREELILKKFVGIAFV